MTDISASGLLGGALRVMGWGIRICSQPNHELWKLTRLCMNCCGIDEASDGSKVTIR